eukprot:SM001763S03264  [mRNA]  locus=s1763:217:1961:- [translate_table: standard]
MMNKKARPATNGAGMVAAIKGRASVPWVLLVIVSVVCVRLQLGDGFSSFIGSAKSSVLTCGIENSPAWVHNSSWMDVWTGLDDYPKFNQSDPITERFARMVEDNIVPWTKVPGIDALMGSTGMVHKETLHRMGAYPQFMSCCGHVRIVDGKVYFRYGGFISVWYRLRRFNQSIKMLQVCADALPALPSAQ